MKKSKVLVVEGDEKILKLITDHLTRSGFEVGGMEDGHSALEHIREDGLMVHDMYLFQVKTPAESKAPWDYYKVLATIPGDHAFPSLADSSCALVKK